MRGAIDKIVRIRQITDDYIKKQTTLKMTPEKGQKLYKTLIEDKAFVQLEMMKKYMSMFVRVEDDNAKR